MVFKPAPGVWTIETQKRQQPEGRAPAGRLRGADLGVRHRGRQEGTRPKRTVDYAYSVQPYTTVRLVELSTKTGVRQTLGNLSPSGTCSKSVHGAAGKNVKNRLRSPHLQAH